MKGVQLTPVLPFTDRPATFRGVSAVSRRDVVGTEVRIVPGTVGTRRLEGVATRGAGIAAAAPAVGPVALVGSLVNLQAGGRGRRQARGTWWLATKSSPGSTCARTTRSRSQWVGS